MGRARGGPAEALSTASKLRATPQVTAPTVASPATATVALPVALDARDDLFTATLGTRRGANPNDHEGSRASSLARIRSFGEVRLPEFYGCFDMGVTPEDADDALGPLSEQLGVHVSVLWDEDLERGDGDTQWELVVIDEQGQLLSPPEDLDECALGMHPEPGRTVDLAATHAFVDPPTYRPLDGHRHNIIKVPDSPSADQ